jgi:TPR repeat protein
MRHAIIWRSLLLAVAGATILTVAHATAATQTITATHTYVMGDNDSRNDARRLCFLEAKRKVLEKAGTFIESSSEVTNLQLSKDQITSYTAAVLSVETVTEDFSSSNGQNTITMAVKAEVDTADIRQRLAAIVADKGLQEKIATQQRQLKQLEEQMRALNMKLGTAPASSSMKLKKERDLVLGNIQELENKKLAAVQAIEDLTEKVRKYIVPGMTTQEVKSVMGPPRGRACPRCSDDYEDDAWNYGNLWVNFRGNIVLCVSSRQSWPNCLLPQRGEGAETEQAEREHARKAAKEAKEKQEAEKELHAAERLAAKDPSDFNLGYLAYLRKDYPTALEKFRTVAASATTVPTFEQYLAAAKPLNPTYSDDEIRPYWVEKVGKALWEIFGAWFYLGVMYSQGHGVSQDAQEAIRWYTKAAEAGVAGARVNLGNMYYKGEGVPQDYRQAREWYEKAAAQSNAVAQAKIGIMYESGEGVPQDYVRAHLWYNLAAANGAENAVVLRDGIAKRMTPSQLAEAQRLAREWKPTP